MLNKTVRNPWKYLKPVLDIFMVIISFVAAYWVRYELQWIRQVEPAYLVSFQVYVPSMLLLAGIVLIVYWLEGSYRQMRGRTFFDEFYIVFKGTLISIATMIVIIFLATPSYYSRLIFGYTGIILLALAVISRALTVCSSLALARLRARSCERSWRVQTLATRSSALSTTTPLRPR